MLEMVLIMFCLGTTLVAITVVVFEWRALIGYWRDARRRHP
jgi:hypothetical protein